MASNSLRIKPRVLTMALVPLLLSAMLASALFLLCQDPYICSLLFLNVLPPRLTPPRPSPHPTPPHPTPPHARSAAGMPGRLLRVRGPGSRKPRGPPGRARRVLAGGGGVRGAERRRPAARPPGLRSRVVQLKCSARSVESCGRLGRAAGRSERQAQRRALRAPGGSRPRLRPYHPERARSRLISEAKQGRAWLVLGWETAWEYRVL